MLVSPEEGRNIAVHTCKSLIKSSVIYSPTVGNNHLKALIILIKRSGTASPNVVPFHFYLKFTHKTKREILAQGNPHALSSLSVDHFHD